MRRLLELDAAPHLAVPTVLVAGTNGKGSTATLLEAMVRAAGYRTGLYTSPHLETVTERLRISGEALSDEALATEVEDVVALAERHGAELPTYFEALTLAAFRAFAREEVDLAILEVGLGGRLDATNVAEPVLSVVTSIGLDHQQQLGPSLTSVAREKAGIFRSGRPAVAWAGEPEVRDALATAADERGAALILVDETARIDAPGSPVPPQTVAIETPRGRHALTLQLAGRHQRRNLAVAVVAAEHLRETLPGLDVGAIARGAASARWPGRLEWLDHPDHPPVLLDAAHNPAGVETLALHLEASGERYDLLFGALADKDVGGMLPPLAGAAGRVTLTRPPGDRTEEPSRWLGLVESHPAVVVEPDPESALEKALADRGRLLVVAGSIYLLGTVRPRLIELGFRPR